MGSALDYEQIAHLYDSYVRVTDDVPFFVQACQAIDGPILELMCGTGRISIPLIEAGARLTCVDASPAMLAILQQKLVAQRVSASLVNADIASLNFESVFDQALVPFQGIHEVHDEAEQAQVLRAIARSLKPGGRLICTLHNPQVRLQAMQRVSHFGPFPRVDSDGFVSLTVELNHDAKTGLVSGWQTVCELDPAGQPQVEHRLPVRFALVEHGAFQARLEQAGFAVCDVFGNYDRTPFHADSSPYIIFCADKS